MLTSFPAWIDSSAIAEFRTCEQRDFYGRKHRLTSVRPNIHLLAGGAFAKALEVTRRQFFLGGKSADDTIACSLEALWIAYGPDTDLPEDNLKSCAVMQNALIAYFDRFPLATDYVRPITVEGTLTIEPKAAEGRSA